LNSVLAQILAQPAVPRKISRRKAVSRARLTLGAFRSKSNLVKSGITSLCEEAGVTAVPITRTLVSRRVRKTTLPSTNEQGVDL
jgi:hypothetical protein